MKFLLKILVFMGIILAGKFTKEETTPEKVVLPAPVSVTPEEKTDKQHQQLQVLLRQQEQHKQDNIAQNYAF